MSYNRRKVMKAGLTALGAAALSPALHLRAQEGKKFKIVALMGDYWHNSIALETHIRQIFSSVADIYFCQASRF